MGGERRRKEKEFWGSRSWSLVEWDCPEGREGREGEREGYMGVTEQEIE